MQLKQKAEMMEALLRRALEYQSEEFDKDQAVNGADLCEWFSMWRREVKALLTKPEPVKLSKSETYPSDELVEKTLRGDPPEPPPCGDVCPGVS